MKKKLFRDLNGYLQERFGRKVYKVTVDAGFGCPNREKGAACIYCNARGSGTGLLAQGVDIETQIRTGIQGLKRKYKTVDAFIAYFQSYTNTFAAPDVLRRTWDVIRKFPEIVGISVGTRPDCVDKERLDVLGSFARDHRVFLELGLQTINEETLRWIRRGHSVDDFVKAVELAKRYNFDIVAHVIFGFQHQTREEIVETARFLSRLGVHGVKIHLLYVPKFSPLEELHKRGEFIAVDRETYVTMVCDFLEHARPDMVIHRLTGDAHRGELIAPQWSTDKTGVLADIEKELLKRNSRQGKLWT